MAPKVIDEDDKIIENTFTEMNIDHPFYRIIKTNINHTLFHHYIPSIFITTLHILKCIYKQ